MQDQTYYKDGVARVIELMRDTFGDYFKEYFDGEPEDIPESQLPCMMVTSPSIAIDTSATATDDLTEAVTIIIALNKKDDIGVQSNDNLTMYRIRKLIIGQDPSAGDDNIAEYLPNTVMYALRKHITLNGGAANNTVRVEFDVNVRGQNTLTQEAYVTLTIDRQALIPMRD